MASRKSAYIARALQRNVPGILQKGISVYQEERGKSEIQDLYDAIEEMQVPDESDTFEQATRPLTAAEKMTKLTESDAYKKNVNSKQLLSTIIQGLLAEGKTEAEAKKRVFEMAKEKRGRKFEKEKIELTAKESRKTEEQKAKSRLELEQEKEKGRRDRNRKTNEMRRDVARINAAAREAIARIRKSVTTKELNVNQAAEKLLKEKAGLDKKLQEALWMQNANDVPDTKLEATIEETQASIDTIDALLDKYKAKVEKVFDDKGGKPQSKTETTSLEAVLDDEFGDLLEPDK